MEISVNGTPQNVPEGTDVAGLLERMELGARRVAVAVNRTIVPKARFREHALRDGDRVEILEAVGGG